MRKYSVALIVLLLIFASIHIAPNGTNLETERTTIASLLDPSSDRLTTNLQKGSGDIDNQDNPENAPTTAASPSAPVPAVTRTAPASAPAPAVTRTALVAVSRQAKTPTAQSAKSPTVAYRNSSQQTEMLAHINTARAQANLAPLVLNTKLSSGAYLKSQDMVVEGYFSHYSPTYGSPMTMMDSLGIAYDTAAENIARNLSVKAAYEAFMNSPPHKANILNADFTKVGLGFCQSGKYLYVTQWFTN